MALKMGGLIIGFVLLAFGGFLVYWGYNESQSFSGQLGSVISGSPSDRVMMFYASGAACGLVGLIMAFKK